MSQQRYVIKEILGKGGMGAVYRAFDTETRREVTLKTLLDVADRTMLELFYKECHVLASLNHPNIVDIYDVGEMDIDGGKKPYFVMPLLPGVTLDKLIAGQSHRLTTDRICDILAQACRGLHAAHERGLVHRDIKPSNIFVMDDDSVKIIDFGVAHLADARTSTTLKGTLHYMAPEQLQMQKPTALSDLFSMAVVAYQCFTRRRPFEGATMDEVVQSILHRIPPPVSELNPGINRAISQVVHKAMAKQPWHRFSTVREFGDNLMKALRGETIDAFDDGRIVPRLQRARKALDAGELDFANEVLTGLEAEGYLHPDLGALRRQVDQAVRTRSSRQLYENARRFLEEEEYQLALAKVQELLQLDAHNTDALALRVEIEARRSSEQVSRWMKLAQQHLDNHAFSHARQAVDNVLQIRPDDTSARKLLSEITQREQEYAKRRKEKEEAYRSAMEAWEKGEVSAALADMERVLELESKAPDGTSPEKAATYNRFYKMVRSDYDALNAAYESARGLMAEKKYAEALALCAQWLTRFPGHALFQALKVDVEEQQRQAQSAYVAEIGRAVEAEPDLDRRVSLLEEALSKYPGEAHFERALQLTNSKRELVNSILAKARAYEEKGQFNEAMGQWEMLRTIYPIYPGLDYEVERVVKRRSQHALAEAKSRWLRQIDEAMAASEFQRASDLAVAALAENPGDAEIEAMRQLARQGQEKIAEAARLAEQALALAGAGQYEEAVALLRRANELDARDTRIRASLVDVMVRQARALQESNQKKAEELTTEVLRIEPQNAPAKSIRTMIADRRRAELVDAASVRARQLQAEGRLDEAVAAVNEGLAAYPDEPRLRQLKATLERSLTEAQRTKARNADLAEAKAVSEAAGKTNDPQQLQSALDQTLTLSNRHAGDADFDAIVEVIRKKLEATEAQPAPPLPRQPPPGKAAAPPPEPVTVAPPKPVIPSQPRPAPAQAPPAAPPSTPPTVKPSAPAPAASGAPSSPPAAGPRPPAPPAPAPVVPPPQAKPPVTHRPAPPPAPVTPPPAAAQARPKPVVLIAALLGLAGLGTVAVWKLVLDKGSGPPQPPQIESAETPATPAPPASQLAAVRVITDLNSPSVSLDGAGKGSVPEGQGLELRDVAAGDHLLLVETKEGKVEIVFSTSPDRAPELALPTLPPGVHLFLILTNAGNGQVFSTAQPAKVSWDGGRTFFDVPKEGGPVGGLKPGVIEVALEANGRRRQDTVIVERGPSVTAILYSDKASAPKGNLLITSNEPGFDLFLNGRRVNYAQRKPNEFIVSNLDAGNKQVRLQKPGFSVELDASAVVIRENQLARLNAKFGPNPIRVSIRGGTPGASLVLMPGNKVLGTIDAAGTFSTADLAPGEFILEVRKKGYRTRQLSVNLRPGVELPISSQAVLEPLTATLDFSRVEPRTGVSLQIQQASSPDDLPYSGPRNLTGLPARLQLPQGIYNLTFTAAGYEPETVNVTLRGTQDSLAPAIRLKKK